MTRTVVDPGVMSDGTTPHLFASSCRSCEHVDFPARARCSRCRDGGVETVELPDHGVLWTWTTQSFPPVAPPFAVRGDFEPFSASPWS